MNETKKCNTCFWYDGDIDDDDAFCDEKEEYVDGMESCNKWKGKNMHEYTWN